MLYGRGAVERRGLSFDSVRLALAVIKLTARHTADNYPELCKPLARINQNPAPPRVIECLDPAETAALVDWMRTDSDLWPMACLPSLAGLRVLEAAALRREDIDFAAETVTVTDTGNHRPNRSASWRIIPVCRKVCESLSPAVESQRVRTVTGELFLNANGEVWTRTGLGLRWRRTLRRAARSLGIPRVAEVPSNGLRRSFATMASRLDVPDRLLKAYLGHSAGDMLGGHYRRIDPNELRMVSAHMDA